MSSSTSSPTEVIQFFTQELVVDNASERAERIRKGVKLVAAAIGPAYTRSHLIPLLNDVSAKSKAESDEVLHALATEYGSLVDFVGGDEHLSILIEPLEALASQEETVVREQAIKSLCRIINKVREAQRQKLVTEHLYPVYDRLQKGEWFTSKVSASWLAPHVYASLSPALQAALRSSYLSLCQDEAPMIRRAATHNLQNLFKAMNKTDIIAEMIDVFEKSWKDFAEEVRCSLLLAAISLSKKCNSTENVEHTLTVIKDASEDKSWKVRRALAQHFDELICAYGRELTSQHLLPFFEKLLRDPEQLVRTLSVGVVGRSVKYLSAEQLLSSIVPTFQALAADVAQPVRAALATLLGPVAQVLGTTNTQKTLLKLILELMKDKVHEVRLNVVCQAGQICEVLNFEAVAHPLLATMQSLITDPQWRIRLSVVNQIPRLAKQFGTDIYQSRLENMFLSALTDSVFSVRECAIENISIISENFGAEWTISSLIPKVVARYDYVTDPPHISDASGVQATKGKQETVVKRPSSYITRICVIHSLMPLSSKLSPEQVDATVLPLMKRALDDPVANVRFAAARVIAKMAEESRLSNKAVQQTLSPKLNELSKDGDVDVMYYAAEALDAVRSRGSTR